MMLLWTCQHLISAPLGLGINRSRRNGKNTRSIKSVLKAGVEGIGAAHVAAAAAAVVVVVNRGARVARGIMTTVIVTVIAVVGRAEETLIPDSGNSGRRFRLLRM